MSYTPRHLAERIRAEQAALEARGAPDGERKTITALFADIKDSMDLLEDLDPEEARRVIDPALQIMMDAVHRYEGSFPRTNCRNVATIMGNLASTCSAWERTSSALIFSRSSASSRSSAPAAIRRAVIVGRLGPFNGGQAFIWDAINGMRLLQGVLENEFGLDLTGWTLTAGRRITPDARVIVGRGINPSGDQEAWIAHLPGDPVRMLAALIVKVRLLNLDLENSLVKKLEGAKKKLEDGNLKNDRAAVGELNAFINQVRAQSGKKIDADDAASLIMDAQDIIDLIEGA